MSNVTIGFDQYCEIRSVAEVWPIEPMPDVRDIDSDFYLARANWPSRLLRTPSWSSRQRSLKQFRDPGCRGCGTEQKAALAPSGCSVHDEYFTMVRASMPMFSAMAAIARSSTNTRLASARLSRRRII